MLVVGIVLVAVAVAAFVFARAYRGRQAKMAAVQRSRCGDVATGPCEISGAAQPLERPLIAPISGRPCVWYRAQVAHRTWREVEHGTGRDRRVEREEHDEVVSDERSQSAWLVDDGSGSVVVDPSGADVDWPEVSFDRFEHNVGDGPPSFSIGPLQVRCGSDGGSIGYHRHEWLLAPGETLYVLGQARDTGGRMQLGEPDKGRYVISTRTEEQLSHTAGRTASIATGTGAFAVAAGAVLIILGLI